MIYLDNFRMPQEERRPYPYKQMYEKELEMIEFAPITIFYGSNGSGKSTLLNIVASKIGISNKTLGNTSEYYDGFVRKCTYTSSLGIPADSMLIRSEDIMELIANRRKKNDAIDRAVKEWFAKGTDPSIKGTLQEEMFVKDEFENIYEKGAATANSSFHNVVKNKLFDKTTKSRTVKPPWPFSRTDCFRTTSISWTSLKIRCPRRSNRNWPFTFMH